MNNDCYDILEDQELRRRVKSLKIELIVVDVFSLNMCLTMVPHSFGIPFVYVSSTYEPAWSFRIPAMASVHPMLNIEYNVFSDKMNFEQRLRSLIIQLISHVIAPPVKTDYKIIEKYRRSDQIQSFLDIARGADMFMYLLEPILNYPIAIYPNMVNLGCVTCKAKKSLPEDLERFVSEARDGVLFVSFGSAVNNLEEKTIIKIRDALLGLKYHVIWRVKNQTCLDDLPKRIRIGTWFPQNDLLGHENVTGFLTHGGTNGQYEALYHGVPMVTLPMFGDQVNNYFKYKHTHIA